MYKSLEGSRQWRRDACYPNCESNRTMLWIIRHLSASELEHPGILKTLHATSRSHLGVNSHFCFQRIYFRANNHVIHC